MGDGEEGRRRRGASTNMTTSASPLPSAGRGTGRGSVSDLASQLLDLFALKEQGVLSDEEFQKAKEAVLSPV